ncbi:MAG: caspase family protein [Spirochaetales bacterium]|nr:caspase family protein [Spirochaetales bacterium]
MKKHSISIIIILSVFSSYYLHADESRNLNKVDVPQTISIERGRQYLLLIGIGKYTKWPALEYPVRDIKEIRDILKTRYVIDEVTEIYDKEATKGYIIETFDRLKKTFLPEDSLLVIYFGHGYFDQTTSSGFWIPVNAGKDRYAQENWLPNSQIRGFIGGIKASHLCIISDSCFSGDLLSGSRGLEDTGKDITYFNKAYTRVSRQVITSGASETVPDNSEFALQLKLLLEKNKKPYLDPYMIYSEIRLGITRTTPLVGNLKETGHQEGASFLLFLKEEIANPQKEKNTIVVMEEPAAAITPSTGHLSLGLRMEISLPVGKLEEAVGYGYAPAASLLWNTGFMHGTFGIGVFAGMNYAEEAEDYSPAFSVISFPLQLLLRYTYPEAAFVSGYIELCGGAAVNMLLTGAGEGETGNIRPAFSVSCGIRMNLFRSWFFGVYGSLFINFLGDDPYTGVSPGLLYEMIL